MAKSKNNSKFPVPIIREGGWYQTVGGWTARVVYVNAKLGLAFAIHNPSTEAEAGPVPHDYKTGIVVAMSIPPFMTPPAYFGHPADLLKEVMPN